MSVDKTAHESPPLIVSVVRDVAMYDKCIARNAFCASCEKIMLDNRSDNLSIPIRYNQAIAAIDITMPRWLVFCHEDFEPREYLRKALSGLDANAIYGPVGVKLVPNRQWLFGGLWPATMLGQISQSNRDGTDEKTVGCDSPTNTPVDTLDCACLIVHSTLVAKHGLRFDENLSFDLYAEDFCTFAAFHHNVPTRIVHLKCHHHSGGTTLPRMLVQKAYLDRKYPRTEMATICTYTIGGGRTVMRRFQKRFRIFLDKRLPGLVRFIFRHLPN